MDAIELHKLLLKQFGAAQSDKIPEAHEPASLLKSEITSDSGIDISNKSPSTFQILKYAIIIGGVVLVICFYFKCKKGNEYLKHYEKEKKKPGCLQSFT